MESLKPYLREIMHEDLVKHYIEGRKKAYAGGDESVYVPDPKIKGFKVFGWQNPDLPYHFEDHYTDNPERPGNFAGFEVNRIGGKDGNILTYYSYVGGLTKEGLRIGEEEIYTRLRMFLGEHCEDVRFGNKVAFGFEDREGKWAYEGWGGVEDYGWEDEESISLNGVVIYKLRGAGISSIKGF